MRPLIYGVVGTFAVSALVFRWWFNPPAPDALQRPLAATKFGDQTEKANPNPSIVIGDVAEVKPPKSPRPPLGVEAPQPVPVTQEPAAIAPPPGQTPPTTDPADHLRNVLKEARAELAGGGMTAKFQSLLQSVAHQLPEITLSTVPDQVHWNKFVLYEQGALLNVFKFTSPLQVDGDLFWTFVAPQSPGSWYILALQDSMGGFENFDMHTGLQLEGLDLPLSSVVTTQHLLDGEIKPGKTYLVYFNARENKPLPFRIAARIVPTRHYSDRSSNYRRVLSKIGLQRLPAVKLTPGSAELAGHRDVVVNMTWLPNGSLRSIDSDGTVINWDTEQRKAISRQETGIRIRDAAFSQDGRRVILVGDESPVTLWDLESQQELLRIGLDKVQATAAIFAPGDHNAYVVLSSSNGNQNFKAEMVNWALTSNQIIATEPGENLFCNRLSLISGGVRGIGYAAMSAQRTIGTVADWPQNLSQSATRADYKGDRVVSAVRSPDGKRDVICSYLGILRVVDVPSGKNVASCLVSDYTTDAEWLPDNRHVVVSTKDGAAVLYDAQENQIRMKWVGHDETIWRLRPSPDGQIIAAAYVDGTIRLWDATRRWHPGFDLETKVDSLGFVLKPIPAGDFLMGRREGFVINPNISTALEDQQRETPQHLVRLTKPYYMSTHEVTVGQFRQFVEATGYVTEAEGGTVKCFTVKSKARWYQKEPDLNWKSPGFSQTDNHPVVNLTVKDAREFCKWISAKEGAAYRLPSEAEWERANGELNSALRPFVSDHRLLAYAINSADLSLNREIADFTFIDNYSDGYAYSAPVGTYLPNMYGLSEILGNVAEICDDAWTPSYVEQAKTVPLVDPHSLTGTQQIERGCSFFYSTVLCRSTTRNPLDTDEQPRTDLGFRVLREISP